MWTKNLSNSTLHHNWTATDLFKFFKELEKCIVALFLLTAGLRCLLFLSHIELPGGNFSADLVKAGMWVYKLGDLASFLLPSFASLGSKDVAAWTKLNLSYYFTKRETGIWRGRRDCSRSHSCCDQQQTPQCPPRTDEVADKGSSWRRDEKKEARIITRQPQHPSSCRASESQLFDPQLAHV